MFGYDMTIVQLVAYAATVILWGAALLRHVVDWRLVARGLRNGLIAAVAVFAVFAVTIALGYGDIVLALTLGAALGWCFLWLGGTLMPLGLLARGREAWVLYGTWVAVPVIVASVGFALAAMRAAPTS